MKATPIDELFNYVLDDQSNEYEITPARNEYDALRLILQEAIESEEGRRKTEPPWLQKARSILEDGIA